MVISQWALPMVDMTIQGLMDQGQDSCQVSESLNLWPSLVKGDKIRTKKLIIQKFELIVNNIITPPPLKTFYVLL